MEDSRTKEHAAICEAALIFTFFALLLLPILDSRYGLDPSAMPREKRALASWPELPLSWPKLERFPGKIEAYVNDHFGFRAILVRANNHLRVLGLRTSPNKNAAVGKQGWLYGGSELALASTPQYQQCRPMPQSQGRAWGEMLEARHRWFAARDIHFAFVVAPCRPTIHPEYLPASLTPHVETTPYDQLLEYLDAHTSVDYIDLRPVMRAMKERWRIYDRTGIHWNSLGACIAANTVLAHLSERGFAELRPVPISRYRIAVKEGAGSGLAQMLGMEQWFREQYYTPKPTWMRESKLTRLFSDVPAWLRHPRGRRPKLYSNPARSLNLVLACDSFGNRMEPYLSDHFRTMLVYPSQEIYVRTVKSNFGTDLFVQVISETALTKPPRGFATPFGEWGPPQKTPRPECWPWPTEEARRAYEHADYGLPRTRTAAPTSEGVNRDG